MSRLFAGGTGNSLGVADPGGALDPTTNAFTTSGWVYFTSVAATAALFTKWNGTTGWGWFGISSNTVRFSINTENIDAAIGLNAWHHIAFVKNGTGAGAGKLYIDGSVANNGTSNQNLANTTHTFNWGVRSGGTAAPVGRLAEFVAWTAVLTPDEILALSKGAPPFMVRPGSLSTIAYYPGWGVGAAGEPDLQANTTPKNLAETGTVAVDDHAPVAPPWPIA